MVAVSWSATNLSAVRRLSHWSVVARRSLLHRNRAMRARPPNRARGRSSRPSREPGGPGASQASRRRPERNASHSVSSSVSKTPPCVELALGRCDGVADRRSAAQGDLPGCQDGLPADRCCGGWLSAYQPRMALIGTSDNDLGGCGSLDLYEDAPRSPIRSRC